MYRKEIVYDRETRDYAMYLDSELVGFARTYHEAEVTLDQLVFELISGEFFREAPTETHALIAAPAPVFEAICALCEESKPESQFETDHAALICNDCRRYLAPGHPAHTCGDDCICLACRAEYTALPAASPAADDNARTSGHSDGLGTPTAPGREDAAPAMCHWCMMPYERMVSGVACCHWCAERVQPTDPRATLYALLKAALEEWQSLGISTPYDVALAQLARLMTPPTGFFLCCPSCGGPHVPTQCPQVALAKYGMGVWEAYMENSAGFLKLVQWATAPRLAVMGEAVAFYLSARWRRTITAHQVLVGWQMKNAAPA